MYLSKKEMEDIWNDKPVGYFSTLKKTLKNRKKYRIRIEPYTYNYLPIEIFEVCAKTVQEAHTQCRLEYVQKHKNLRPDGYVYSTLT